MKASSSIPKVYQRWHGDGIKGKIEQYQRACSLADQLGGENPAGRHNHLSVRPIPPISMGSIAVRGAALEIFQPLRRTPMHDWHEANAVLLGGPLAIGVARIASARWRRPTTDAVKPRGLDTRENLLAAFDASSGGGGLGATPPPAQGGCW